MSGSSAPRSARTGPSGDARPSGLRPPHGAKALHFTGHMDGRAEPQCHGEPARDALETPRVCGVGVPCHVVVSVAFSVARAETPVAMYRTCARACPMRAPATTSNL